MLPGLLGSGVLFVFVFYFYGFSYYFKSGLGWDISFSATAQCITETSIAHYTLIHDFTFILKSQMNSNIQVSCWVIQTASHLAPELLIIPVICILTIGSIYLLHP